MRFFNLSRSKVPLSPVEETLAQVKRIPAVLLLVILFVVALSFVRALDDRIFFKAIPGVNFEAKPFTTIHLGANEFFPGKEGRVYWQTTSYMESYVLTNLVREGAPFDLFDVFYLLLVDFILFWMLRDISADNYFSKRVLRGIDFLSIVVVLYILKPGSWLIANYCLSVITDKQFELMRGHLAVAPFVFTSFLFQFVVLLIRRGQKIQEEQQLTV